MSGKIMQQIDGKTAFWRLSENYGKGESSLEIDHI